MATRFHMPGRKLKPHLTIRKAIARIPRRAQLHDLRAAMLDGPARAA